MALQSRRSAGLDVCRVLVSYHTVLSGKNKNGRGGGGFLRLAIGVTHLSSLVAQLGLQQQYSSTHTGVVLIVVINSISWPYYFSTSYLLVRAGLLLAAAAAAAAACWWWGLLVVVHFLSKLV